MSEKITLLQIIANNFSNVLTVIGSIGGAIAGGVIAAKSSRQNDIQKLLREERLHLYTEFFKIVERIRKDPFLVFNDEYFNLFESYKTRLRLLASNNVVQEYEKFFLYIDKKLNLYKEFSFENNPFSDEEHTDWTTNENGDLLIELEFNDKCEQYKNSNVPTKKELKLFADNLYDTMREDLGSSEE